MINWKKLNKYNRTVLIVCGTIENVAIILTITGMFLYFINNILNPLTGNVSGIEKVGIIVITLVIVMQIIRFRPVLSDMIRDSLIEENEWNKLED